MVRLSIFLLCFILFVGCDSAEDPSDVALFGVTAETSSGAPAGGLELSMEYALGGGGAGGDRPARSAVLRYFDVYALGGGRFSVEWETEEEEGVARFVIEAGTDEGNLEDVAEVAPHGPNVQYTAVVEGAFDVFRLRVEDADGTVEYSDAIEPVVEASPAEFSVGTGYPNPFASATTIRFLLPEAAAVTVEVLDLEGRPAVQRDGLPAGYLMQEDRSPGQHGVVWEAGPDLIGGFYRVRLTAGEDTASVLALYTGPDVDPQGDRRWVTTALGQTDEEGRFATDDRARFPQFYDGLETEYRDENNVYLGDLRPSDEIVLVLRDGAGREQRYERTLTGDRSAFELTWDPE